MENQTIITKVKSKNGKILEVSIADLNKFKYNQQYNEQKILEVNYDYGSIKLKIGDSFKLSLDSNKTYIIDKFIVNDKESFSSPKIFIKYRKYNMEKTVKLNKIILPKQINNSDEQNCLFNSLESFLDSLKGDSIEPLEEVDILSFTKFKVLNPNMSEKVAKEAYHQYLIENSTSTSDIMKVLEENLNITNIKKGKLSFIVDGKEIEENKTIYFYCIISLEVYSLKITRNNYINLNELNKKNNSFKYYISLIELCKDMGKNLAKEGLFNYTTHVIKLDEKTLLPKPKKAGDIETTNINTEEKGYDLDYGITDEVIEKKLFNKLNQDYWYKINKEIKYRISSVNTEFGLLNRGGYFKTFITSPNNEQTKAFSTEGITKFNPISIEVKYSDSKQFTLTHLREIKFKDDNNRYLLEKIQIQKTTFGPVVNLLCSLKANSKLIPFQLEDIDTNFIQSEDGYLLYFNEEENPDSCYIVDMDTPKKITTSNINIYIQLILENPNKNFIVYKEKENYIKYSLSTEFTKFEFGFIEDVIKRINPGLLTELQKEMIVGEFADLVNENIENIKKDINTI